MEQFQGTIEKILFSQEESHYFVFLVKVSSLISITARGTTPIIISGQQITISGNWSFHPKFGKQLEIVECIVHPPTTIIGLKRYLGSGMIKGIGKVYAEKIVDYFGQNVLDIIDKTPDALTQISGIGQKRIDTIKNAWKDQKHIATIMTFLQDKGISPSFATKIYKKYGNDSVALITQDPYRLAYDIFGIGFKGADQIAQKLGFEKNSVQRVSAGIIFSIQKFNSSGHIYAKIDNLKKMTCELLEIEQELAEKLLTQSLHSLYNKDTIKLITYNEEHFLTLSLYYHTEKSLAKKIKDLTLEKSQEFDLNRIYTELRTSNSSIELTQEQQQGIMSAFNCKISIITGGPGTGKTTLVKTLIAILDQEKKIYKLAAPTGRAAKRLGESTKKYTQTIHRLLEFNPSLRNFMHNDTNALKLDFLIIDEASMIDVFLANSLLKATSLASHILFLGDIDQLPSVGAGNFLKDMIECKIIPVTKLGFIFRQSNNSLISYNAHKINNGEFPVSSAPCTNNDYHFINEQKPENLPNILKKIYSITLKKYNIDPENAIVLCPMNKGSAGTQNLNMNIQDILNPKKTDSDITRFGTIFKVNDRVMQIKNNYDKNVFNGDIGTITKIDNEDKKIIVSFDLPIEYDFVELDELIHAYAISIHKSQGSEFEAVIIPIFTQHFTLLQRNLLYTALTRAKKQCILIGQSMAISMAIKNNKQTERITFLKQFLTTDLTCR